jgi:hypothetical protein
MLKSMTKDNIPEVILNLINIIPNHHILTIYELLFQMSDEFKAKPFDEMKMTLIYRLKIFSRFACELSSTSLPYFPEVDKLYHEVFKDSHKLYQKIISDPTPTITKEIYDMFMDQFDEISQKYMKANDLLYDSVKSKQVPGVSFLERERSYISKLLPSTSIYSYMSHIANSFDSKHQKQEVEEQKQQPSQPHPSQPHPSQHHLDFKSVRSNSTDFTSFLSILQGLKVGLQIKFTPSHIQTIVDMGIEEKIIDKNTINLLEICKSLTN